jgi:hypothetical protein
VLVFSTSACTCCCSLDIFIFLSTFCSFLYIIVSVKAICLSRLQFLRPFSCKFLHFPSCTLPNLRQVSPAIAGPYSSINTQLSIIIYNLYLNSFEYIVSRIVTATLGEFRETWFEIFLKAYFRVATTARFWTSSDTAGWLMRRWILL